ncbi:MAG: nuclear transport factor 2 family protein [Opitutaceae bacterium]
MNAKIIAACEAYSLGQGEKAFSLLSDDVQWHIVGDHSIIGLDGVKEMCAEAAAEGKPNFKNARTITGKHHVIVEGSDLDRDIHYCDIYTAEGGMITEITSYCLAAIEQD